MRKPRTAAVLLRHALRAAITTAVLAAISSSIVQVTPAQQPRSGQQHSHPPLRGVQRELLRRFQTQASPHVLVYHTPRHEELAISVSALAESSYVRLVDRLGVNTTGTVAIAIAYSHDSFRALTAGELPEWGIAAAIPDKRFAVIQAPELQHNQMDLREVVGHEMTHVMLDQATGGTYVPLWFTEGVAVMMSRPWSPRDMFNIARAVLSRRLIPLEHITFRFPRDSRRAALAYSESLLALMHLENQLPEAEDLASLLAAIMHYEDFEQGIKATLGIPLEDFHNDFFEFATRKYRWPSLLTSPMVIWTTLTALFLLAGLRVYLRSKSKMEEWEKEESW